MKYLVDSDYAISYLKGKEEAVSLLQKYKNQLGMSVISLAEILEGIYGQPNEKKRLVELKNFLTGVNLLNIDEKISEKFAEIRSKLRRKGELIGNFDILIAATAKRYNLTLLTANKREFNKVENLKISFMGL